MTKIMIGIATYKRPQMLDALLNSLLLQKISLNNCNVKVHVAVVDNDFKKTAKPTALKWRTKLTWPLQYETEPRRGISFVRNKLVSLSESSDFLVFIDDDETAHSTWIDELITVQRTYNADVVAGPVLAKFQVEPPDWILKGNFFVCPVHKTGEKIKFAGTCNVLIRKNLLDEIKGPFEEKLGLQGGEDFLFFSQIRLKKNPLMVWAARAIVEESIPKSKMKKSWLIKRSYGAGLSLGITDSFLKNSFLNWRLQRMYKGIGNIIRGGFLFFPYLIMGQAHSVKALCFIAKGFGSLASIFNMKFSEYKKIHGQ